MKMIQKSTTPAKRYPKNLSLTKVEKPIYLMAPPLGFHAQIPDNPYMQTLSKKERKVDKEYAFYQWFSLYKFLSTDGLVYVLPIPKKNLQDLTYASNLGVVLEGTDTAIISNFTVEPRFGETKIGVDFFKSMGFDTVVSPYKFEGDAELKWVRDNLYVGAYGIRSDIRAYNWMEEKFGIKVIKVKPNNPSLYHLDVNFMPVTKEDVFCCTESFSKEDLKQLESCCTLHDIPTQFAKYGAASGVRYKHYFVAGSCIKEEIPGTEYYELESKKNEFLKNLCDKIGLRLHLTNISEFFKGGGDLSCLILQINRKSFNIKL